MPVFPAHLLNPSSVKFGLTSRVALSPPSLSGVVQALRTDGGGIWQLQLGGIILRTDEQVRIWNAWDSYLAGGAQRVTVPILQNKVNPRGLQGGRLARYGSIVFTGDKYFPDSVNYSTPVVVATASSAPLRATTIAIAITQGVAPRGGETFSIAHPIKGNKAYRVQRAVGNGQYVIDPPLREAVASGTTLNFDWPVADMIALPNNDLAVDIQNNRGEVSITFQEAF